MRLCKNKNDYNILQKEFEDTKRVDCQLPIVILRIWYIIINEKHVAPTSTDSTK